MTAWTSERGASAIAATWKSHAPIATPMPIANHFEVQRLRALRSGCFHSTSGAAHAPRCLNRKAKFVKKAHRSASNMPI